VNARSALRQGETTPRKRLGMPSLRFETPNEETSMPTVKPRPGFSGVRARDRPHGRNEICDAMGEDGNGSTHGGSGVRALLRRSYPCAETGALRPKMFIYARSCLSSKERTGWTSSAALRFGLGPPTRIPTSDFRYRIPTRPSDPGYRDSVTFKSILRPIASAKKADPCQASKLPPMAKTSPCSPSCTRSGETRAVT
jgi:hypothetical protein